MICDLWLNLVFGDVSLEDYWPVYIQSNEIHNVVALIQFLLVLRCQLYMFRTVTVHPQELLCRHSMCRLWYVVRNALPDTSSWYNVLPKTLYQLDVSGSALLNTYHSLHIQYLQTASWGWTVMVRNLYSWHLSTNKHLISATTLCISLECIYIYISYKITSLYSFPQRKSSLIKCTVRLRIKQVCSTLFTTVVDTWRVNLNCVT